MRKNLVLSAALLAIIPLSASGDIIFTGYGTITDLGDGATSIDNWYFTVTDPSPLVDPTLEILVTPYPQFDVEWNLFRDDGTLDTADFVFNMDVGGLGISEDVSFHALALGNYVLRISGFNFGNGSGTDSEAYGDINLADVHSPFGVGSYDLRIFSSSCRDPYVFAESEYVGCDVVEFNGSRSPVTPVPEPSTLALLSIGLVGVGLMRRRRII